MVHAHAFLLLRTPRARSRAYALARLSVVLGALGLVGLLPVVGSLGALLFGNLALNEMSAHPSVPARDDLARTGVILGWFGLGLSAVAAIAGTLILLLFLSV